MTTLKDKTSRIRPKRRWAALGAILACGWLTLVWGCLAGLRVYESAPTGRAALSPICCENLNNVMREIDRNYRRAQRMPVRKMRDRNFAIMEEHARRIAGHATEIKDAADLTESSPEDIAMFERLAQLLATHAAAPADAAANRDRVNVRQAFARLTSTCNSCHAAFRGQHGMDHRHKGGR